ncbi:molybdopterin-dependent oxidoreductase [Chitinibacter bivalviorum]|uniref:Molybdopterin-dependent oxidoreductase n=1 Tax=Chitinibacter bivalviorum TaxID=2739434 RepID=A0A7H9BJX0_9NEIS|nr:molybdopterin-dependent oxidoreductase [Chitinibacter bivalviorum]QLG88863.1 molybdopterin-dependent oxidoreductase [Chitinibacter bivalviorum]
MLRTLVLVVSLLLAPLGFAADADAAKTVLKIAGKVTQEQALSIADLDKLPQKKLTVPTPWYPEPQTFEGPLLRDVIKLAGIKAGTLKMTALNDYTIEIPVSDAQSYDVIVASKLNGKPMAIREKGPLFVIYPFDSKEELRKTEYYRRCIWQLKQIVAE